jgi:hypothetical protein
MDTYRSIFGAEVGVLLDGHTRWELQRHGGSANGRTREVPEKDIFRMKPPGKYLDMVGDAAQAYSFGEVSLLYASLGLTLYFGRAALMERWQLRAWNLTKTSFGFGLCFVVGYLEIYFPNRDGLIERFWRRRRQTPGSTAPDS